MTGGKPATPASTVAATSPSEIAPSVPIIRSSLPADSETDDREMLVYPSSGSVDFNGSELQEIKPMVRPLQMTRDLMSPYVWTEPDARFEMRAYAVTRPDEPMTNTGIIWVGWSNDGIDFAMLTNPLSCPAALANKMPAEWKSRGGEGLERHLRHILS